MHRGGAAQVPTGPDINPEYDGERYPVSRFVLEYRSEHPEHIPLEMLADEVVTLGVTSGGYGHTVGKSLALGYVPKGLAAASSGFEIEIIGERRGAKILKEPPYDPSGSRMRV